MAELKPVHPTERFVLPGGKEVDIDVEMVPLMRQLWAMDLRTLGCCQDFGESILHDGHHSTSPDDNRQRFADFYAGQAWIKMPMPDAIHLLEILGKHAVFGQRVRRWTHHEAWMCIGYIIHGEDGEAAMSTSAQLHFPRVQLDELTAALFDA